LYFFLTVHCFIASQFAVFDDYAECIDELNSCQWQVIYHGLTNDTIAVLSGNIDIIILCQNHRGVSKYSLNAPVMLFMFCSLQIFAHFWLISD